LACPKEILLLDLYQSATRAFYDAVVLLAAHRGGPGFEDARLASEQARTACEKARRELEQHRAEHGC
jgi:hypothetical protein